MSNRLLAALMRFSMGLRVAQEELAAVKEAEQNCSKHLSVINDIFSYEKEVKAAKTLHKEGGVLCSSVQIIANEADVSVDAAKRILLNLSREWELRHKKLVAKADNDGKRASAALLAYLKGLEYQMSGNELWSRTTKRYNLVEA
jgi:aristolochene synthase